MRAVVTGGAGFIGSHLADALLDRGDEVVVLDDLATGRVGNVPGGAELVEGDVADEATVATTVAGADVVFHQAALGSVARSVAAPLASDAANVRGTLTVLHAAHQAGVGRVVLASSSSVYGGATLVPTPESAPLVPRSPYAVTKLAGEHYARVSWELHGLETVCLRYFNVFGPRQRPDSRYAAVVPLFIDALLAGRPVQVHGDGRQCRDFTFVADAVQANLAAAAAPADRCAGRVFNVARGAPSTVLDLVAVLGDLLGVAATADHVAPRAGDVRSSHADISAARRDLGFEPSVGFAEGLCRTLAWFRGRSRGLAAGATA
ncbi:MAG TPA: NAD-dependent epimerase/dehydratase family protein [Acidimicrobiales bacterium]|nr:NAD-dependent epimerase/dehydratase family protein [Acidimicrobiales bacterium]